MLTQYTMTDWPARWFRIADEFAHWSKDRSTKVGCVIVSAQNQVISGGYNGFPRGVVDDIDARHDRPVKYLFTEHAERNAIYDAARRGIALEGSTIYSPLYPCADCARAIIQSGIVRIITTDPTMADYHFVERWRADMVAATEMFTEAEIDIVFLEGEF